MSIIEGLNKAFENKFRIGTMAILVVNDWVDFNTLKKLLKATDGNLASHLIALEKKEYLKVKKEFVGRKPRTSYKATESGKVAFQAHLNALEKLLKNNLGGVDGSS
ncbi:MAG TPA: transcriptional regulator [Microscillaceae bacterium]|nr:transcriptional regulator [Microscillaceae bacterium]